MSILGDRGILDAKSATGRGKGKGEKEKCSGWKGRGSAAERRGQDEGIVGGWTEARRRSAEGRARKRGAESERMGWTEAYTPRRRTEEEVRRWSAEGRARKWGVIGESGG